MAVRQSWKTSDSTSSSLNGHTAMNFAETAMEQPQYGLASSDDNGSERPYLMEKPFVKSVKLNLTLQNECLLDQLRKTKYSYSLPCF